MPARPSAEQIARYQRDRCLSRIDRATPDEACAIVSDNAAL